MKTEMLTAYQEWRMNKAGHYTSFEAGANWQKEQYKELIESHSELLNALILSEIKDNDVHYFDDLECFVDDSETREMYYKEYERRKNNRILIEKAKQITI